jgi:hypothetical protein
MSAHLYWRIYVGSATGSYVGIYSLDFQDAAGVSLCVGGTPIASTEYAFYAAARAFPGGATNWISNNEGAGAWLGYHFAAPVTVEKVLLAGFGPCADTPAHIITAQLQSSDDGVAWSIEFETDEPGGGWVSAVPVTYDAPPPSVAIPLVNQAALIVVGNEQASGATISQLAIISVGREYQIPLHLHGWLIPSIWGNPFFIERGQLL